MGGVPESCCLSSRLSHCPPSSPLIRPLGCRRVATKLTTGKWLGRHPAPHHHSNPSGLHPRPFWVSVSSAWGLGLRAGSGEHRRAAYLWNPADGFHSPIIRRKCLSSKSTGGGDQAASEPSRPHLKDQLNTTEQSGLPVLNGGSSQSYTTASHHCQGAGEGVSG